MKNNYQLLNDQENDALLNFILQERFFKYWEKNYYGNVNPEIMPIDSSNLELFITPTCNQKCEYCYLIKHKELYPQEINKPELILQNLDSLINYFIEKQYYIPQIDLFSGEIWHTDFGITILNKLYDSAFKGFKFDKIMIPSNGTFMQYPEYRDKIQTLIRKFKEINIRLTISFSIDGLVLEELNRPRVNDTMIRDENFYHKIFEFCKYNEFVFHPMVSSHSIDKWKENFIWWKNICKEYNADPHKALMLLEVRDDNWSEQNIKDYCDFLKFLFLDALNKYNNNIEDFIRFYFGLELQEPDEFKAGMGYTPYLLIESSYNVPCSISTELIVRLGDLSIVPCHRLSYPQFIYGKFNTDENNKITHITSNNVYMPIRTYFGNHRNCTPICDTCLYKQFCIKGCLGAQYESNNDPFFVNFSVCNLEQAKLNTLVQLYMEYGIYDKLKTIPPENRYYSISQDIIHFIERINENVLQKKEAYSCNNNYS